MHTELCCECDHTVGQVENLAATLEGRTRELMSCKEEIAALKVGKHTCCLMRGFDKYRSILCIALLELIITS